MSRSTALRSLWLPTTMIAGAVLGTLLAFDSWIALVLEPCLGGHARPLVWKLGVVALVVTLVSTVVQLALSPALDRRWRSVVGSSLFAPLWAVGMTAFVALPVFFGAAALTPLGTPITESVWQALGAVFAFGALFLAELGLARGAVEEWDRWWLLRIAGGASFYLSALVLWALMFPACLLHPSLAEALPVLAPAHARTFSEGGRSLTQGIVALVMALAAAEIAQAVWARRFRDEPGRHHACRAVHEAWFEAVRARSSSREVPAEEVVGYAWARTLGLAPFYLATQVMITVLGAGLLLLVTVAVPRYGAPAVGEFWVAFAVLESAVLLTRAAGPIPFFWVIQLGAVPALVHVVDPTLLPRWLVGAITSIGVALAVREHFSSGEGWIVEFGAQSFRAFRIGAGCDARLAPEIRELADLPPLEFEYVSCLPGTPAKREPGSSMWSRWLRGSIPFALASAGLFWLAPRLLTRGIDPTVNVERTLEARTAAQVDAVEAAATSSLLACPTEPIALALLAEVRCIQGRHAEAAELARASAANGGGLTNAVGRVAHGLEARIELHRSPLLVPAPAASPIASRSATPAVTGVAASLVGDSPLSPAQARTLLTAEALLRLDPRSETERNHLAREALELVRPLAGPESRSPGALRARAVAADRLLRASRELARGRFSTHPWLSGRGEPDPSLAYQDELRQALEAELALARMCGDAGAASTALERLFRFVLSLDDDAAFDALVAQHGTAWLHGPLRAFALQVVERLCQRGRKSAALELLGGLSAQGTEPALAERLAEWHAALRRRFPPFPATR